MAKPSRRSSQIPRVKSQHRPRKVADQIFERHHQVLFKIVPMILKSDLVVIRRQALEIAQTFRVKAAE